MTVIPHVVTRFAPSPTGRLHIGHAWSAIQAHDLARKAQGRFLLRIEDIDATRCRPDAVAGIFEDMEWLGLSWDEPPLFQSTRSELYVGAVTQLAGRGLAYPCFCTRAEIAAQIAASGAAPHGPEGPVYPGTCRTLSESERLSLIAAGAPHAWRLDMRAAIASLGASSSLEWTDAVAGRVIANPESAGDVVLSRKDAAGSYHLCATYDDAESRVTHIVRGGDLRAATHIHRLIQAVMGWPAPCYLHHPLLVTAEKRRLAKRDGGFTIAALREAGVDGRELADQLRSGCFPGGLRAVEIEDVTA